MNRETETTPGPLRMVYRYTRALSRWIKAGRPVRGETEIEEIFERFCRTCEAFDEERTSCRLCGCRVNRSKSAPLNKIAMATEHCPNGTW